MPRDSTPPTAPALTAEEKIALQRARAAKRMQSAADEVGIIIKPRRLHALDNLILHADCKAEIIASIRTIMRAKDVERIWRLSSIMEHSRRSVLNFYGPSGTGKTRAAIGVARRLNRPLYQIDYSKLYSKWIGQTEKGIAAAFRRARELRAVLFFDEADTIMSRRANLASGDQNGGKTAINNARNTFMQELDRFDGVVIVTTNFFGNYDEAMLRRIARNIQFLPPDAAMREAIYRLHLPAIDRIDASLSEVAAASETLTGGDILNVCVNAMLASSAGDDPEQWRVSQGTLIQEAERVRRAKQQHSDSNA